MTFSELINVLRELKNTDYSNRDMDRLITMLNAEQINLFLRTPMIFVERYGSDAYIRVLEALPDLTDSYD